MSLTLIFSALGYNYMTGGILRNINRGNAYFSLSGKRVAICRLIGWLITAGVPSEK